jgi:hypothetical protein
MQSNTGADQSELLNLANQLGQQSVISGCTQDEINRIIESLGDDPDVIDEFQRGMHLQQVVERMYVGELVDHGSAPYQNKRGAKRSYFVTLNTTGGPKTIWGVDLERAFEKSETKGGEQVKIDYLGSIPVLVDSYVRDDQNKIIGVEKIETLRNTWNVQKWDKSLLAEYIPQAAMNQVEAKQKGASAGSPTGMSFGAGAAAFSGAPVPNRQRLSSLSQAISSGGQVITNAIARYSMQRAERELRDVLALAKRSIVELRKDGFDLIEQPGADPKEAETFVKNYFDNSINQTKLLTLVKTLDSLQSSCERALSRGQRVGLDAEDLEAIAAHPIRNFMAENEKILQNLQYENESLYARLNTGLQSLLEAIAKFFSNMTNGFDQADSASTRSSRAVGLR